MFIGKTLGDQDVILILGLMETFFDEMRLLRSLRLLRLLASDVLGLRSEVIEATGFQNS